MESTVPFLINNLYGVFRVPGYTIDIIAKQSHPKITLCWVGAKANSSLTLHEFYET